MKKLAGVIFIREGIKYDYCFMEAIESMLQFCDHVFCVCVSGEDETTKMLWEIRDTKFTMISQPSYVWENQQGTGSAKLCYFTNIAIDAAKGHGYEYVFSCQADEIVSEKSYQAIRQAVEQGEEGYMISRKNLWKDPYHELIVPDNRQPCSTKVIRLAKSKYRAVGDAESLGVPNVNFDFVSKIKMVHVGFVRKREVMKAKVENMQLNVFELSSADSKLYESEVFNPDLWFNPKTDLALISEPLPKIIQKWANERAVTEKTPISAG